MKRATRVKNIEDMLRNRKPEIDLSGYTYDELKALAEISRKQRTEGLTDLDLIRYREIVTAAGNRK